MARKRLKKNAFTLPKLRIYLDNQWDGGEGPLLNNGYVNIFYCLGEDEQLFAVNVDRDGGAWRLSGWRLGERDCWYAGNRIFRNNR